MHKYLAYHGNHMNYTTKFLISNEALGHLILSLCHIHPRLYQPMEVVEIAENTNQMLEFGSSCPFYSRILGQHFVSEVEDHELHVGVQCQHSSQGF